MLRRLKKHWKIAAIVALCAYVALFWVWTWSGFPAQEKICDEAAHASDYNCAARQIIALGHWIKEFHDELLVVGTFLLAGVVVIQIRDARVSSQRQLRAYIVQKHSVLYDVLRTPHVGILVKNTGQTPAYEVSIWAHLWVGPFPFDGRRPPDPRTPNDKSSSIIGPGEEITSYVFGVPIPDPIQMLIARGEAAIYVYGEVNYRDAFHVARWTRFHLWSGRDSVVREVHARDGGGMATYSHEAN